MRTAPILLAALFAASSLIACGGDDGDGGGGDGGNGGAGSGSTTSATGDTSTGETNGATTDAATGGGSTSCEDVCAKAESCAGTAGDCPTVCPQLPEACKSCIANTACDQIESACAGPCTPTSGSGSTGSGGNCGAETTPCEFDADCCSGNCSEGFCFDNGEGSFCEFDADCASGNCHDGVCHSNESGSPCEFDADCASGNCADGLCS